MRGKGVGEIIAPRTGPSGTRAVLDQPKEAVRVQPETWKQLAALRHPLLDPDGNLVAFESFDRVIQRLLAERKADGTSRGRSRRSGP